MPDPDTFSSVLNLNMAAANWPNSTSTTNLEFKDSDFAYFQPYVFGQFYSSPSPSPSEINIYKRSPGPAPYYDNMNLIKELQIQCDMDEDVKKYVDNPVCDPKDKNFITNFNDNAKQCFRSQICANSLLSKSLATLTSSEKSHSQHMQDLEDVYFYDCLRVFNISAAILFFISIIIYKSLYTTQS
jgi:hypothetical protein